MRKFVLTLAIKSSRVSCEVPDRILCARAQRSVRTIGTGCDAIFLGACCDGWNRCLGRACPGLTIARSYPGYGSAPPETKDGHPSSQAYSPAIRLNAEIRLHQHTILDRNTLRRCAMGKAHSGLTTKCFLRRRTKKPLPGGGKADLGRVSLRFAPILVHFPRFRSRHVCKRPGRCVDTTQFTPIVVNSPLPHRGALTAEWLTAFISGLILCQNVRFLISKCEKVRRDKIR